MKETLLKFKEIWEERKAKGDPQAEAKLLKIDKTLTNKDVSKINVLEELKAKKAKK